VARLQTFDHQPEAATIPEENLDACWFALNPDPRFASNIDPPFEPVFGVR
jgi:hypothetical protein